MLGEIGAATSPTNFDPVIRDKVGLGGLGQLFPAGNPLRIIPQANFGGIPNAANMTYDDRLPIDAGDERYIVLDNLSWTTGQPQPEVRVLLRAELRVGGPAHAVRRQLRVRCRCRTTR